MKLQLHLILPTLAGLLFIASCNDDNDVTPAVGTTNSQTNKPYTYSVGCSLNGTVSELGTIYISSGNSQIDYLMNQELVYMSSLLNAYPAFYYFDDSQAPNAFANPAITNQFYPDGTVCYGVTMFNIQYNSSYGGTNVPIVLSHEFGHIVAMKNGLSLPTKNNELFADYIAGCYMFFRNKDFKLTDINSAIQGFYNLGDNEFSSPNHHGTSQSRATCIQQGYNDCFNAFYQQGITLHVNNFVTNGVAFVTSNNFQRTAIH